MTGQSRSCSPQTSGRLVSESRSRFLPYLAFISLALIWGGSLLAIKLAVRDLVPTALLLFRSISGFVALALIVTALRNPLLAPGWRGCLFGLLIMSMINLVVFFVSIGRYDVLLSSELAL